MCVIMSKDRKLKMKYAGGLVKHLGIHLYSTPVPALAELISNCWDADAENIEINIPLNRSFADEDIISIKDDGSGMTFEECNMCYLIVGRDKREETGEFSIEKERIIMGRKGLGKLAGFGIAQIVEVRTVKNGWLTHFELDYNKMTKSGEMVEEYEPKIISDKKTKEKRGTEIILKKLKISRAINKDQFMRSMNRRFAVFSDDFVVKINNEIIEKKEVDAQYRWPEKGIIEEDIDGAGKIKWWIGTLKKPIQHKESRGISVIVRGKIAQEPFFFDLVGGFGGQLAEPYTVGEVEADFLDQEEDLIATGRQTILWENERANKLKKWGQAKVKEIFIEWQQKRKKSKIERLQFRINEREPGLWARIQRFEPRARKIVESTIDKLSAIPTIEEDELVELVRFILNGVENKYFIDMIKEINDTKKHNLVYLLNLLKEWDIIEAISLAQIVRGRLQIIDEFERMILDEKAYTTEWPQLHSYLENHPWLVNPQWEKAISHKSLLETFKKEFKSKIPKKEPNRLKQLDFLFLGLSDLHYIIIEIKRPSEKADVDDFAQLNKYMVLLNSYFDKHVSDRDKPKIDGLLVAGELLPEGRNAWESYKDIDFKSWPKLLERAKNMHNEYFKIVKSRAPEDDPRMEDLVKTEEEMSAIGDN